MDVFAISLSLSYKLSLSAFERVCLLSQKGLARQAHLLTSPRFGLSSSMVLDGVALACAADASKLNPHQFIKE
ncbi:hypothetical protein [Helicobacter ailurogastricus]|uniref:hypothetical protein n=1 Tax=Helicobacter ailurogastricus TaxID=1578720 RepID=UPI0022CAB291|nr:hypothetical protein [Helicobacter ailurogastricus]GLH57633.1 hypothetical protein NHP214376_04200 [Helicobacter ailurogastricus]GLH59747.1 hypothetical protein NHP214377_10160 [Helicobacter ailurogastricus]